MGARAGLVAGLIVLAAVGLARGEGNAEAKNAYHEAENLLADWKLAEAEGACKAAMEKYPEEHSIVAECMKFLSRVEALQGRTEEAFETYVKYRLWDLERAKTAVEVEGVENIRAGARLEVARACENGRTIANLKDAVGQYERLIKDYPKSPLAENAQKSIEGVKARIAARTELEKNRPEIEKAIEELNAAFEKKDTEAFLQLVTPEERKTARGRVKIYFEDRRRYQLKQMEFSEKDALMWVACEWTSLDNPGSAPKEGRLKFLKTAEGWKLSLGLVTVIKRKDSTTR